MFVKLKKKKKKHTGSSTSKVKKQTATYYRESKQKCDESSLKESDGVCSTVCLP